MTLEQMVSGRDRILVRQTKEWGEILIDFETRNRFQIMDENGARIGSAAEESGGLGALLGRQVLGHCRAAKVHLYGADDRPIGLVDKQFRWYFHRCDVLEGGRKIGSIQRKFSILHRKFSVEDPHGREVLQIMSPLFRIWTFKLLMNEHEVGRVSKQWGGLLREMFTDADTFGVEFQEHALDVEIRKLLLGAVFLIDFTCFENNTRR